MARGRKLLVGVVMTATLGVALAAEPAKKPPGASATGGGLFDARLGGDRKAPITVIADTLEYDYKANVVVYRGTVLATQGDMKVKSDTLTVTLVRNPPPAGDAAAKPSVDPTDGGQRVRDIVAVGNVRIDHGTRWGTGGRAVFDQTQRTVVLTEDPVLHDGVNEVAGERVVVFLDEDRSVVEGGRRRVKAVLYPGKDDGTSDKPEKPVTPDNRPAGESSTARAGTP